MTNNEYLKVKELIDKIIIFINWRGAPFDTKKKKIIKELSMVNQYCKKCVDINSSLNIN